MDHLHVLRLLLSDVRAGVDSEGFIRRIQEALPRDLNVSRAGVYLYDAEAGGLLRSWLIGAPRSQKPAAVVQPVGHSISGICYGENRTVHVPDCRTSDVIPQKYVEQFNLAASLAVPIPGHSGEPLGVLRLDRDQPIPFDEHDIDFFETLGAILGTIIANTRVYHELKAAERRASHAASHDPLTALPNRRLFEERVDECLARHRRSEPGRYALLFLDLDGFKEVNDSLGHGAGDMVLVEVAERLRKTLREGDILGRLGGDEFGILLEPLDGLPEALAVADRVLECIGTRSYKVRGHRPLLSASVGIVPGKSTYGDGEELLRDADVAMYAAKRAGKGRWVVFDEATMGSRAATLNEDDESFEEPAE